MYRFPPRFAVTHLPASRRIDSPFGHFDLTVRQEIAGQHGKNDGKNDGKKDGAATVVVTGDLDVERDRVSAAEYPAFRRFLAEVDSAVAERITAAPRASSEGASKPDGQGDEAAPGTSSQRAPAVGPAAVAP